MRSLFIYSITLLLFSSVCLAQGGVNENEGYKNDPLFLFAKNNMFSLENYNKNNISILQNNVNRGVLIQQIGNFDYANANLKANEINVSIVQNGEDNKLNLNKTANTINQKVVQEGNRNNILDYTFFTNSNINMELIQKGDNQNIQNFGTNSLSRNMKVIQSGNGASVIILNNKNP